MDGEERMLEVVIRQRKGEEKEIKDMRMKMKGIKNV